MPVFASDGGRGFSPQLLVLAISIGIVASTSVCQAGEPRLTQNEKRLEPEQRQVTTPVEEFVRRAYIHGVPYEEAAAYGPSVVSKLLEMLADTAEEEHWSNIVVTLCIVGNESVLRSIQSFISENGSGPLSRASYAAKTNAITALGYLINRTHSEEALHYAERGLQPSTWTERIHWRSPYNSNQEDLSVQLAQMSVMALALSGHPDGRAALEKLKTDASHARVAAPINDLLDDAIETNEIVRREGLAKYLASRIQ